MKKNVQTDPLVRGKAAKPVQPDGDGAKQALFYIAVCLALFFICFELTKIETRAIDPPALSKSPDTEAIAAASPQEQEGTVSLSPHTVAASPSPSHMAETDAEKDRVERYADIDISDEEMEELAAVVFLEASTQSMKGQQAVAEVVLNRVIARNFPNTVHDVLYQGYLSGSPQFSTAPYIAFATPTEPQYEAVELALYGPSVLPDDVVYFSKGGENEYVWGTIEDHVFCHQYPWATG